MFVNYSVTELPEHLKMKHTENNYIKSLKSSQWFLCTRIGTGNCQLCKKYW